MAVGTVVIQATAHALHSQHTDVNLDRVPRATGRAGLDRQRSQAGPLDRSSKAPREGAQSPKLMECDRIAAEHSVRAPSQQGGGELASPLSWDEIDGRSFR